VAVPGHARCLGALAGYLSRVMPTLLAVIITRRVLALNAVVVGDALVHMATGPAYVTRLVVDSYQ
jgi:hypothetical protein